MLLPLEGANHTRPGEAAVMQERQATDVRKIKRFSQDLNGDLVMFVLTQENCEKYLAGK